MSNALTAKDLERLYSLSYYLLRNGKFAQAEKILVTLCALQPKRNPLWRALGVTLHQMGRHQDAVTVFALAYSLDPSDASVLFYQGESFLALGEKEKARAALSKGVELAANLPQLKPFQLRALAILRVLTAALAL